MSQRLEDRDRDGLDRRAAQRRQLGVERAVAGRTEPVGRTSLGQQDGVERQLAEAATALSLTGRILRRGPCDAEIEPKSRRLFVKQRLPV